MADFYTMFSVGLALSSKEEGAWCRERLTAMDADCDGDFAFAWRLFGDNDATHPNFLHIYSEESGNVDQVAAFVQSFLKKFSPDKSWVVTYAATCSKARLDAFGGGAVIVTADKIVYVDAHEWAATTLGESPTVNHKDVR